jgi:hypothetical protein
VKRDDLSGMQLSGNKASNIVTHVVTSLVIQAKQGGVPAHQGLSCWHEWDNNQAQVASVSWHGMQPALECFLGSEAGVGTRSEPTN